MPAFDLFRDGYLLHFGFALAALAYLLRDILWLRLVAVASYAVFAIVAVERGADAAWQLLPWYCAFTTINLGHAARLFYQRRLWRFTPDEAALHAAAFPALSRVPAKRLMGHGRWRTLSPGQMLTRVGVTSSHVFVIASGRVNVTLQGRQIAELRQGQFVGEIGFVARRAASATAIALLDREKQPTRVLAWDVKTLRRKLEQDADLRSAMESALGADLARKVADQNVVLSRSRGQAEGGTGTLATSGNG